MIRCTPLGGANEIGASCTLVEVFGARLLIDAGMRPSARRGRYPDFDRVAEVGGVHAVLITHAHNDHIGGLPVFARRFPGIPIYATVPTMRITRLILRDSVAIMERDFNGEPDFGMDEVEAVGRAFVGLDYYEPRVVVAEDDVRVTVTLVPAGHILGAAMIMLEAEDLNTGELERAVFPGDTSFFDQRTIPGGDLEALRSFEPTIVFSEGTYGIDEHPGIEVEEARFAREVAQVLQRGGKVLVPSFAIGRAQNVALILRDAQRNPERIRRLLGDPSFSFPDVQIIVDGMCRSVVDQYDAARSLLQPSLQAEARAEGHAFYDSGGVLRSVKATHERLFYIGLDAPLVVISSSGMLNGGPAVAYAKEFAKDPRSAIFLVGYQDEESGGGVLAKVAREAGAGKFPVVQLGDEEVEVRCQVAQYRLSAHSDAREIERLLDVVRPLRFVLVHGTPRRLAMLRQRLEAYAEAHGIQTVIEVAHNGETISVKGSSRFDAPAFPDTSVSPGPWVRHWLEGEVFSGSGAVSFATPWINAALSVGRQQPMSGEELARLSTAFPDSRALGADEVLLAKELAVGSAGLWKQAQVGRDLFFVPVGPGASEELEEGGIVHLEKESQNSHVRALRGDRYHAEHWARVRRMGIASGDLFLFVSGGRSGLRLLPAIARSEAKTGFNAFVSNAVGSLVGVNQIVARVGPWPATSSAPNVATVFDMALLAEIRRAISDLLLEGMLEQVGGMANLSNGTNGKGGESNGVVGKFWMRVVRKKLSSLAGTVGSAILTRWSVEGEVQTTIQELVALLGGEAQASPAMVISGLRELVDSGLLQMGNTPRGIELKWSSRALASFAADSDKDVVSARLGPVFGGLLRAAFHRAVREVETLGLSGNKEVGYWLAPPRALEGGVA